MAEKHHVMILHKQCSFMQSALLVLTVVHMVDDGLTMIRQAMRMCQVMCLTALLYCMDSCDQIVNSSSVPHTNHSSPDGCC